jgi:hypothetical protein
MLSFLKNHPFAVEAFFKRSVFLTFAIPKADLQPLIPSCLTLDTFNDEYGFIVVAMVQTNEMRPKGFPKILGNDFFLIGYRVLTRYTNEAGKTLRGLYILKSETDKIKMKIFGNIFTQYHFSKTDIQQTEKDDICEVTSVKSDFRIQFKNPIETEVVALPTNSPFPDWQAARKFAGPLIYTFTFNEKTQKVIIVEGSRKYWHPKPITVLAHHVSFLQTFSFKSIQLANAFVVNNIPYYWNKAEIESWKG